MTFLPRQDLTHTWRVIKGVRYLKARIESIEALVQHSREGMLLLGLLLLPAPSVNESVRSRAFQLSLIMSLYIISE